MTDEFRVQIVELKKSFDRQKVDTSAGKGIRPINHEAGVQSQLLDRVLSLYDKHFVKVDGEEEW